MTFHSVHCDSRRDGAAGLLRDPLIGWRHERCKRNLHLIVNNARFLIFKPGNTADEVELEARFPAGNKYRLEFDHVVQPLFPGYKTQGGVFIDGWLHGTTGTGSPLMPKEYTQAAWWGIVHVYINGEKADTKVAHLMTTEVVRQRDYSLAIDEEMRLAPSERHIPSQQHHTHLIVIPIKPTPKGPVFEPVKTAFELPNGKKQPFIHMMFEEDTIVEWKLDLQGEQAVSAEPEGSRVAAGTAAAAEKTATSVK